MKDLQTLSFHSLNFKLYVLKLSTYLFHSQHLFSYILLTKYQKINKQIK